MLWKLLCLVGNLVSPLLNGLDEVLDDGSLGNLSDWGKAIGGSLGETKTNSWDSGSSSGDGVSNMGRSSGVVYGESDGRLGESNLGGSWEGSGIGSWASSISSGIGTRISSAVVKTSSISLDGNSLREGSGHTGRENDKLVHGPM